jgi:MoaA/NifB/PqqE/SkfB family radical SAM enzyme
MDFALYRKIIDDLSDFDRPLKVLRLYKDGEPLMNPRFADMVRYAKEREAFQIDTTTNGTLLSPERNLELISAGLDRINISVNGVPSKGYVENIRHLYEHRQGCVMCVKTIGDVLSDSEKQAFLDTFGDISDRIFIEHLAPCWPEFDMSFIPNQEVGIYGQAIERVEVCPYIFYSMSVNSDGVVSACFLDWARKLTVGDARTESLKDIWNGEKLSVYRKLHLMKKRAEIGICANCGQLSHGLPDNIDAFAEQILKERFA